MLAFTAYLIPALTHKLLNTTSVLHGSNLSVSQLNLINPESALIEQVLIATLGSWAWNVSAGAKAELSHQPRLQEMLVRDQVSVPSATASASALLRTAVRELT